MKTLMEPAKSPLDQIHKKSTEKNVEAQRKNRVEIQRLNTFLSVVDRRKIHYDVIVQRNKEDVVKSMKGMRKTSGYSILGVPLDGPNDKDYETSQYAIAPGRVSEKKLAKWREQEKVLRRTILSPEALRDLQPPWERDPADTAIETLIHLMALLGYEEKQVRKLIDLMKHPQKQTSENIESVNDEIKSIASTLDDELVKKNLLAQLDVFECLKDIDLSHPSKKVSRYRKYSERKKSRTASSVDQKKNKTKDEFSVNKWEKVTLQNYVNHVAEPPHTRRRSRICRLGVDFVDYESFVNNVAGGRPKSSTISRENTISLDPNRPKSAPATPGFNHKGSAEYVSEKSAPNPPKIASLRPPLRKVTMLARMRPHTSVGSMRKDTNEDSKGALGRPHSAVEGRAKTMISESVFPSIKVQDEEGHIEKASSPIVERKVTEGGSKWEVHKNPPSKWEVHKNPPSEKGDSVKKLEVKSKTVITKKGDSDKKLEVKSTENVEDTKKCSPKRKVGVLLVRPEKYDRKESRVGFYLPIEKLDTADTTYNTTRKIEDDDTTTTRKIEAAPRPPESVTMITTKDKVVRGTQVKPVEKTKIIGSLVSRAGAESSNPGVVSEIVKASRALKSPTQGSEQQKGSITHAPPFRRSSCSSVSPPRISYTRSNSLQRQNSSSSTYGEEGDDDDSDFDSDAEEEAGEDRMAQWRKDLMIEAPPGLNTPMESAKSHVLISKSQRQEALDKMIYEHESDVVKRIRKEQFRRLQNRLKVYLTMTRFQNAASGKQQQKPNEKIGKFKSRANVVLQLIKLKRMSSSMKNRRSSIS